MGTKSRATLKEWFKRGKYPREEHFRDWIDSFVHRTEDKMEIADVEGLPSQLNSKYSAAEGKALKEDHDALRREYALHTADSSARFTRILQEEEVVDANLDILFKRANDVNIYPFNGILDKPNVTRWGIQWHPDAAGGRFVFKLPESGTLGYSEADYNQDGQGREDRIFRCGATLYRVVAGELKEIGAYDGMIEVRYKDLWCLREEGKLCGGTLYRITDYVTQVTEDAEARDAGHCFDIVVAALDSKTLSERAWAMRSKQDVEGYFSDAKLEAWQVWYCLDNDTTRFQWAHPYGQGVIYRLIDEWGNDCPYDFKNIQFKRCRTSGDFVERVYDENEWASNHHILSPSMEGLGNMSTDPKDAVWFYTFSFQDVDGTVEDASMIRRVETGLASEYYNRACNSNKMGPYYIAGVVDDEVFAMQALNNIVLCSNDPENCDAVKLYGNRWEAGCYNMSLYEHCFCNSFGPDCSTLVAFKFYGNKLGAMCQENVFGGDCTNNILGDGCERNIFGNGCRGNTLGPVCNSNYFESDCTGNELGYGSCGNLFGSQNENNTFGPGSRSNDLHDYCSGNSFGPGCQDNRLLPGCNYNSFGNSCLQVRFGQHISCVRVGEGVSWLDVRAAQDDYNGAQGAVILNGTQGTAANILPVMLPTESKLCHYVGLSSEGVLKIWVPADMV